jgi:uncharacterized membrane protein YqjE
MADDTKPHTARGLRGVLSTGLGAVQTRLQLLAVEVQEEKLRIAAFLFNSVLSALFIGFGVIALVVLVTVALWDSHRLLALGVGTAVLLGAGLITASTAARLAREGTRLFAASLAELHRDREELQHRP